MRLLVIGAGGHAKVVVDSASSAGHSIAGVLGQDGDPEQVLGFPVARDLGGIDADGFIVAVGDNATRASLFERYLNEGMKPATVIHPSAVVAGSARIGEGTFIAPGVIVNCDTQIGRNAILNTGCAVDHDCSIGDHAHVGPRVGVCGGVRVGEGALLGVGSCLAPVTSVGDWSVIGAGAAVISAVPSRETWAGVPARPLHGEPERRP